MLRHEFNLSLFGGADFKILLFKLSCVLKRATLRQYCTPVLLTVLGYTEEKLLHVQAPYNVLSHYLGTSLVSRFRRSVAEFIDPVGELKPALKCG